MATLDEIKESGYSLTPGRYVGTVEQEILQEDFESSMRELQTEFLKLTGEARDLESKIIQNFKKIL